MSEEEKHPIRNGIIATVVGGIILAIVLALWDGVIVLFTWLVSILVDLWAFVVSQVSVPWGVVILMVLFSMPSIWRIVKLFTPRKQQGITLRDYTEDRIFNVIWRWRNTPPSSGNLSGFCPKCETRLILIRESEFGPEKTSFFCETCQLRLTTQDGDLQFILNKVCRQIERKINSGEWKQVIESNKKPKN